MTAQTRIRAAGPDDLWALLPLIEEFYRIDRHEFQAGKVERALQGLLGDDRYGVVWLASVADEAAGYAVVTWSYALESGGRDALIDELYVRDRSQGIGGALLDVLVDDCRRRGLGAIFLETEAHNERVRVFYRRHGFEVEDSVWMSLSLRAD